MATRSDGSGPGGTGDAFFRPSVRALTPYQPGKPVEDVQRELGLERVVKLASNEGPFGPFPAAEEALARSVARAEPLPGRRLATGCTRRWPSATASPSTRSSVGAGADGCIDMLSQATLDPGDEIVCGWPSFPSYVIYAAKQGAVPRTVELAEHRYDLDALLDAVTPRTKLVYICHPNNPTGTMNTTDELDRYFERVPEHVLTVVDQAYFEYIDDPDYPDAVERYLKAGRQVAVLRTFSKIYGLAGLRVGYAVAPASVCAAMAKVRRPFDITSPAQIAALASIGEDAELARRRAVNAEGLAPPRIPAARARPGAGPVGRELPLRRHRRRRERALRAAAARGSHRASPDRLRVDHRDPRLRRHARRARPPRGRARTGAAAGLIAFARLAQPPDEDAAHRAAASACSSSQRLAPASARGWRRSRSPSTSPTVRTRRGG